MSSTAVTLLDVVNKILIRLRDQAVLSVTSSITATGGAPAYTDTIVRLVNDAKREVEDSFDWIALQDTITIATTSGTNMYNLENGSQSLYTNQRSRVLDVYNTTTDVRLAPRPYELLRQQNQLSSRTDQEPYAYAVSGVSATQSLKMMLYSTPDATYSLSVECVIPQDELTANTDYFKVNWYPVYLRALALAIRERGEDEGELSSEVQSAYEKSLGDAIAYEQTHKWQGQGGGDWVVYGDF
jgi:hypothetical protein|tara:strand:- start:328 stop:1050 length:723 start_codon:yes stop_codon:yes gene_type:complete